MQMCPSITLWRVVGTALAICAATHSHAEEPVTPPGNSFQAPPAVADDPKSLVGELGHDLFAVREGATNKLIEKGITAKPVLVAALTSTDAEVRFRAKRILSIIVDADFQRRKRDFIADVDGTAGATLPGWSAFKELVGSDPAARDLFVEMQDAQTQLLEAYERGPKEAATMLKECSQTEVDKVQPQGRRNRVQASMSVPIMAALLFVGGDPQVAISDEVASRLATLLPENPSFRPAMTSISGRRAIFRKLYGRFVARDMSFDLMAFNLLNARSYNLREALDPAVAALKSEDPSGPNNRALRLNAMLLVANLGGKEQLSHVERYFNDSDRVFDSGGTNQPMQAQMRDLALAVAIKLSEQDPKKFGFAGLQFDRFNLNMIAFRNDAERTAAFKKWEDWQKAQKQASGAKAPAKSDG